MKTSEEVNDGAKALVDLLLTLSLDLFLESMVSVGSQVDGGVGTVVDEGLEGSVSTQLEWELLLETHIDHLVHLSLKFKQLFGEGNWILE